MTPRCRFCAEELGAHASTDADARCPSCGERQADVPDAGPRPTPVAFVLAAILGAIDLAMGGCCGVSTATNAVVLLGPGGPSVPVAAVATSIAISGALCLLHISAGLGLVLRQSAGRVAGVGCAIVDIGLGAMMIVGAVGIRMYASPGTSGIEEGLFWGYLVGGLLQVLFFGLALWLLLHRTTKAAFAAPKTSRG